MANILTDGDMESASIYWTSGAGCTRTKSTASPHGGAQALRMTLAAGYAGRSNFLVNNTSFVDSAYHPNTVCVFSGYARGDGASGYPYVNLITDTLGGSTRLWTGTTSTLWQPFELLVHSGVSWRFVYIAPATNDTSGGSWCEFDDLLLEPIGAYAPWSTLLRRRL